MVTKLSTKGQVVLPGPIRRKLGLQAGDSLDLKIEGERIVLTPRRNKVQRARIVTDPITGLPVLRSAPGAPPLTNEQVHDMLADFP